MPGLSTADHRTIPPRVEIPREYNAAHDLIERNLRAGRAWKIAFVDDAGPHTYGQLGERVNRFANALTGLGVEREQRVLLCLLERDMGTGVIMLLVLFTMLFAAGTRLSYLVGAVLLAIPIGWKLIAGTPYRMQRWLAYLDPWGHREGTGFQLVESLLGIGNGGLLGQGLGQGKGKLFYLPAAHTDFIAAVIAEETGLLGIAALLLLYGLLVWRGLRASLRAAEPFGAYLALGFTTLLGGQALVNLAVVFGLLPTKGLTLPFVSYGGSSLMTLLAAAGVLLAVSGDRGGWLRPAAGAARTAAPGGGLGGGPPGGHTARFGAAPSPLGAP